MQAKLSALLVLVLALVLVCGNCSKSGGEHFPIEENVVYVGALNGLNLREEPHTGSRVQRTLPRYTKLFVLEKGQKHTLIDDFWSHWYKVDAGGETGWVFGAYLTQFPRPEPGASDKPIVLLERHLLFPDGRVVYLSESYIYSWWSTVNLINIYDSPDKKSRSSKIKDTNAYVLRLPEYDAWLYLVSEDLMRHGFVWVYDFSEKSFYGDFEKNAVSGNRLQSLLIKEYEVIKKHRNVKRYGPLLEIDYSGKTMRFWKDGGGDSVVSYLILEYYEEPAEFLLYTQFYEGSEFTVHSLRTGGGLLCKFEGMPFFNKSRDAVFSVDCAYGEEAAFLKIFSVHAGNYTQIKNADIREYAVEGAYKEAGWVNDNEIRIDCGEKGVITARRANAGAAFAVTYE